MDLQMLVTAATAIGLIVNTIVILGVVWKGGIVFGRIDTSIGTLTDEVGKLREQVGRLGENLTRATADLDNLERRMVAVEDRRHPR
jgi:hypothetical protein